MKTKCYLTLALFIAAHAFVSQAVTGKTTETAVCATVPNDGTFTRTSYSVSVYTESGHPKGSFAVYLHHGQRYINFHNTWICIQGKSRFFYAGNWYVIR